MEVEVIAKKVIAVEEGQDISPDPDIEVSWELRQIFSYHYRAKGSLELSHSNSMDLPL